MTPADVLREERRRWAVRGLFGGAAAGAGLLTYLMLSAGEKVTFPSGDEVLIAYVLFTLLSAALGAGMGWFHGETAAARRLAADAPEPTRWQVMLGEAGKGYRIGLIVGGLYCVVALGILLEARAFPPWLLAARAAVALALFPLGVAAFGLVIGMARPR